MLLVEFLCSDATPVHGDTARNSQICKLLNWVLNWQLGTELDLTQSGVCSHTSSALLEFSSCAHSADLWLVQHGVQFPDTPHSYGGFG